MAACRLSLAAASGAVLHCHAQAPHCNGFSRCRPRALGAPASAAVACGLWRMGSVISAHGLRCPAARGIFRDRTHFPCICGWILNHQATREVPDLNFFSVKWVEKAPLCIIPTHCFHQALGAPCLPPRIPERPTRGPSLLTMAGPRYCFDLTRLGRPSTTSLIAAKTTARVLLSAISAGWGRAVWGPLHMRTSEKSWPMSSQGS